MLARPLRLWTGPLPTEELYPTDRQPNPLLHWVLHPIKRHIARTYLTLLQRFFGLKVVAIAGSNGKTTTRTMLKAILPQSVATMDSVTSTYNIPTTILKLRPWTKYFICEMSVEYIGDMKFYRWLVTPNIAVMTMIDLEHTKYFGSIEAVAQEENYLLQHMPQGSTAVINGNSPKISLNTRAKVLKFGTSPQFDAYIKSAKLTSDFETKIQVSISDSENTLTLPIIGKHFAHPVAATLLVSHLLHRDADDTIHHLLSLTPPNHRANIIKMASGAIIIDDTYNSNPSSAKASIETAIELAKLTNRELVLILSQMNELGQYEIAEHQKLKNLVNGFKVFSIGPAAKHIGQNFSTQEELFTAVQSLKPNSKHLILFKSSRGWKLENLLSRLQ